MRKTLVVQHNEIIQQIELDEVIVRMRNDGIFHVFFKPHTQITVELQMKMREAYWKLTDINRPFIFEGGEFVGITKEARLNAIEIEEDTPIYGSAIIVKNLGQRIIADYYYRFNKPRRPVKIVRSKEEALEWINENFTIPKVKIPVSH